jgi:lysophospholipase L1-like esterase
VQTVERTPELASSYTQYIALGDSFTSGYGVGGITKGCARSPSAWPQLVHSSLGIANPLTFAACSGATTLDIWGNGPDVVDGYQTRPQIEELPPVEQRDTALITIQIGGNDLRLDETLQQCAAGLNGKQSGSGSSNASLSSLSSNCVNLDKLISNFNATIANTLEQSLTDTYKRVRAQAPKATIVAVGYPHLLNATTACSGRWWFVAQRYRKSLNDVADAINAKVQAAATTAGISAITSEVVAEFQGHEMCSRQEWIASGTTHPNAAGHQAFARVVGRRLPAATNRMVMTDDPTASAPGAELPSEGAGEQSGVGAASPPLDGASPGESAGDQPEEEQGIDTEAEQEVETEPEQGSDQGQEAEPAAGMPDEPLP